MRWIAIAALVALVGCTAEPADNGGGRGGTAPKNEAPSNPPAAKGRLTLVYYNMPG